MAMSMEPTGVKDMYPAYKWDKKAYSGLLIFNIYRILSE
jgi:hypothetical protein